MPSNTRRLRDILNEDDEPEAAAPNGKSDVESYVVRRERLMSIALNLVLTLHSANLQ
jgi:hypothetical protein